MQYLKSNPIASLEVVTRRDVRFSGTLSPAASIHA